MPLVAAPFIFLALAMLLGVGAGLSAKHRREEITTDEQRLWAAIVKAQQTGNPNDFMSAANLARLLNKPKTADELTAQATAASKGQIAATIAKHRCEKLLAAKKNLTAQARINGDDKRPIMAYIYQGPKEAYAVRMAIGPTWAERKEMGIFDNVDMARDLAEGKGWRLAWYEPKDLSDVLTLAKQRKIA